MCLASQVVEKVIARLEARLAERGEANPAIASASDIEQVCSTRNTTQLRDEKRRKEVVLLKLSSF